jgi:uncharacterized protein (DUF2062 family)
MAYYRFRLDRLDWRGKLGLVLAIALGLAAAAALIVVSIGVAVILLPIVAVALVIGRWRLNKLMAESAKQRREGPSSDRTIEISDYTVIDGKRRQ